ALLVESYRVFPPGETWLGAGHFELIASFAGLMFETAVRIALPVTLVLLLVQILTGVLSRSAPALNLFALGLPAGVLAGIAALIIAAPIVYDQFEDLVSGSLAQTESVLLQSARQARRPSRQPRSASAMQHSKETCYAPANC